MRFLPLTVLLALLFSLLPVQAQLFDDFSDGDFTQNPAWTGDTGLFQVNSNFELQSNGNPANDTIYLATASSRIDATEWRFRVRYNFGPSTSNLIRIYLVSDQAHLQGLLNGYYVGIGESGSDDSIDLFRQDGNSSVQLIDGVGGEVANTVDAYIQVLRDAAGNWTLNADVNGDGVFTPEGTATDLTYTTTTHSGVWIKHSSTRNTAYFFDDLYVGVPIQDTLAPVITGLSIVSPTELEVQFSEETEALSAENTNHYLLDNGIGEPIDAQQDGSDPSRVLLAFGASFTNNTAYTLSVSNVEDLNGNAITPLQTWPFTYFVPDVAALDDVIINEIFPDPNPSVGLPEAEYLELYNRSAKTFDLAGWTLDNGTTTGTLPAFQLQPGAYVIICSSADAGLFSSFGEVISPGSWPALVNLGDDLGLRSAEGTLIDTVAYRIFWYKDTEKNDGGFSLERMNPDPISCPPSANWRAADDPAGGTPGAVNSVFSIQSDTTQPLLTAAFVISANVVEVCFSESMDPATLSIPANYLIDGGIGSPLGVQIQGTENRCVSLAFAGSLTAGTIYTLSLSGQSDCSGNALAPMQTAALVIGGEAAPYEVVITELFPDFSPAQGLPEAEFVEIHNRSAAALSLSGWSLSDGSSSANLRNAIIFPDEYLILCAAADSADFASFGKVLTALTFPSLNNTSDSLFLRNAAGDLIDFVFYDDAWYRDESKADGGYSLEKIDTDFIGCNQPGNWRASLDPSGGTPGRANSVAGSFSDQTPPQIIAVEILDANTLQLVFDEQMDLAALENPDNYFLDQGIGIPVLALATQPHLQSVRLVLAATLTTNVIYTLSFSDLADCAGNALSGSQALGLPVPIDAGDVLLNEILFNPYTGGSDFVEIFNYSDKILDLSQLRLGEIFPGTDSIFNADVVADRQVLFLPRSLVCLTTNVNFQQVTYLPPADAGFYEMSRFPSYDDARGEVVIFTGSGLILDRFAYEDDYQFPSLADDNGVSLERLSLERPTQDPGNWQSAASTVRYATPGYENSQALALSESPSAVSLEKQTFSPNGDGQDDVLAINYDFDFAGANVRVSIFDSQGRPISVLMQNSLLSPEPGTIFWDGRDGNNTKADIGIYVVLFEVTNASSGKKEVYKLACVLADKL